MIKIFKHLSQLSFLKFFRRAFVIGLITIIVVPLTPPVQKARASTGYPVPHIITNAQTSLSSGIFLPLAATSFDATSSTEAYSQTYMTHAGTWSGLSIYFRIANASGSSTFTVRKNGVDTGLTVTVPQSSTGLFQDLSNTVSVSVGDLMSIGFTTSAGTASDVPSITALFESNSGDSVQYNMAYVADSFATGSQPRYFRISGLLTPNVTTEASNQSLIQHAGTISGLSVYVSTNSRTTTTTFRSRINGANGNQVLTVASGATGLFQDLSNSDSVSAADLINSTMTWASGSNSITLRNIQFTVISTNPREITFMSANNAARNASTSSSYNFVGGRIMFSGANESIGRSYPITPGVYSGMAFYASANTATQNLLFTLRKNTANGNQSVSYSGTGWMQDTTNSDTMDNNDYTSSLAARVAAGSGSTTFQEQSIKYTMDTILPTYTQSAFRLFNNANSTDVGSALAAQDTAGTLAATGDAFRLRTLLHVDTNRLGASGQNFKLQYVGKGSGTCASPSGGTPSSYTDVTGSTLIAYNDNASPSDAAALTSNANDPTHSGHTIVNQTYEELNNFTNSQAAILSGQDGKWDFSLKDNGAAGSTAYCFRAVQSDGTVLSSYTVYPQITTAAGGTLSADIVDAGGTTVASPSISMSSASLSFVHQTATGTFGASAQKIRVDNSTGTATWTLSLAADNGVTAFWDGTPDYDFNDPTANAADGGDADSLGGQMTVNPSGATITPEGGCSTTNISAGSSSAFSQGATDSITLASAASGADTNCYWDITGVSISQTIPAEQSVGSYSIDMTLSIIAS